METSIPDLLAAALRARGHAPLVTFRDAAGGERTELSVATFENWAQKAANLLAAEFDVGPGDAVGLALDPHWTTPILSTACWLLGATVVASQTPESTSGSAHGDVRAWFVAERLLPGWPTQPPVVAVGSGLAGRCTTDPESLGAAFGFAEEVLAHGDAAETADAEPSTVALRAGAVTWAYADLLAAADGLGDRLTERARALLRTDTLEPAGAAATVGALAHGAALVLVANADDTALARIAAEERTDLEIGPADG